MKVFFTDNWDELKEELEKKGKAIFIESLKPKPKSKMKSKIKLSIGNSAIDVELKDVLKFLASLDYDFVGLNFDAEIEDIGIKKANTVDEVLKLEDFETLNTLINKIKKNEKSEECGAIGVFIGFVRKKSDNKEVLKLEFEKFDEIFYKKLEEIEERLKKYEGVVDVKIYHKSGVILPKEDIVYVVVMGKHRKDIWEPLRRSMEIIKRELPIWKKEVFVDGEVWVHNKNNEKLNKSNIK